MFDSLPVREERRFSPETRFTATGIATATAIATLGVGDGAAGGKGDAEGVERVEGGKEEEGRGDGKGKRGSHGSGVKVVRHQDAKRVLLAMKAHDGLGGDGTVVYYIVQEGEVKPRQN